MTFFLIVCVAFFDFTRFFCSSKVLHVDASCHNGAMQFGFQYSSDMQNWWCHCHCDCHCCTHRFYFSYTMVLSIMQMFLIKPYFEWQNAVDGIFCLSIVVVVYEYSNVVCGLSSNRENGWNWKIYSTSWMPAGFLLSFGAWNEPCGWIGRQWFDKLNSSLNFENFIQTKAVKSSKEFVIHGTIVDQFPIKNWQASWLRDKWTIDEEKKPVHHPQQVSFPPKWINCLARFFA